ncbi:NAD-dependent epimerase/dehydratase family protein [Agromyces laixinhei]|uniref:NAD-dependent epimerase/dehydratase family protein n=1 Tax=Agromyces laixinhei TaxID=2585717 RepID=UPI0012EE1AE0|nr:NAD(P)-dependent oxidoreductase [Agromyces laixinhei]
MRVLLAGSTGAIGRPLIGALRAAGHHVTALIRSPGSAESVRELGAAPLVADVMQRSSLLRAVDGVTADAVIHEATALRGAAPRLRADDPTNALRRAGTGHLLDASRVVGARRFVTQSMTGGYGYRNHGMRPLVEDAGFGRPHGGYADSIIAGCQSTERQVFEAHGIDGIALRYGLFYGPRAFSDLFATMMRKRTPVIPFGGGGTNSWIHVDDAATATVAALERGVDGQAYNIVDDVPIDWNSFADAVAVAHDTPRAVAIPRWLLRLSAPYLAALMVDTSMRVSNTKARHELRWAPAFASVPDGLAVSGDRADLRR